MDLFRKKLHVVAAMRMVLGRGEYRNLATYNKNSHAEAETVVPWVDSFGSGQRCIGWCGGQNGNPSQKLIKGLGLALSSTDAGGNQVTGINFPKLVNPGRQSRPDPRGRWQRVDGRTNQAFRYHARTHAGPGRVRDRRAGHSRPDRGRIAAIDHRAAAAVGSDERSLYRVMRFLASHGFFEEKENRSFDLTPLATAVRSDAEGSFRPAARMFMRFFSCLKNFEHSLRTGGSALTELSANRFSTTCRSIPRKRRFSTPR